MSFSAVLFLKIRNFFCEASASLSTSFIFAVTAFIFGVALAATVFGNQSDTFFPLFWFSAALCGLVVCFLPVGRTAKFVAASLLFFVSGFLRYLAAGPTDEFVFLPQVKFAFMDAVSAAMPEPHASFVSGLLVGEGKLPSELKAAFIATGTVHVMALSGWNVSVIAKYLKKIFLFLPVGKKARTASVAGMIALFTVLVGAPSSLVRAAVMALIMVLAESFGREARAGRLVILAGAVMLAFSPRLVSSDLGFLLSFAATLGLVYFSKPLIPFFFFLTERWGLRELAAATTAATFATLPVMLFAFGRFSLVSLPANLFLLPFIPVTMLAGFAASLAALVSVPLGQALGTVAQIFTAYDFSVVRLFSRISAAGMNGVKIGFVASLIMAVGFIIVAMHLRSKEEDGPLP